MKQMVMMMMMMLWCCTEGAPYRNCVPSYCICEKGGAADCRGRHLREVPKIISHVPITSLDLSYNYILTLVNNSFKEFSNLTDLIITDNGLCELDTDAFKGQKSLELLDLSRNKLHKLHPESFLGCPNLHELILNNNPLLYVPQDSPFLVSSSLFKLELSSCNISRVSSSTFFSLRGLMVLDLSNNNLEFLKMADLELLQNLTLLLLANNNLFCGNDFGELVQRFSGTGLIYCKLLSSIYATNKLTNQTETIQSVELTTPRYEVTTIINQLTTTEISHSSKESSYRYSSAITTIPSTNSKVTSSAESDRSTVKSTSKSDKDEGLNPWPYVGSVVFAFVVFILLYYFYFHGKGGFTFKPSTIRRYLCRLMELCASQFQGRGV